MGRMEHYKRDAYHVEKHSRPTPEVLSELQSTRLRSDRASDEVSSPLKWHNQQGKKIKDFWEV